MKKKKIPEHFSNTYILEYTSRTAEFSFVLSSEVEFEPLFEGNFS